MRRREFNNGGGSYSSRNRFLMELGFTSYRQYLESDLWKEVKAEVFKRKGRYCLLCGCPASEVHHNRYHKNDLDGSKIKFLIPICRGCHLSLEFSGDDKRTLRDASGVYLARQREIKSQRRRVVKSDDPVIDTSRPRRQPVQRSDP